MSWLYSQALVAEYSEANSSDGAPCAPSSGTPTPQAYLCNGKTTAAWKRFPCGMTCSHFEESRGEALFTWFREGFPAPTSASLDAARVSMEKQAPCGSTWHELSVKFDLNLSSWRTHRCLFDEVLQESSVILPPWGMMRDGVCWEPTTSAPRTRETEYGFWPTPCATEVRQGLQIRREGKKGQQQSLSTAVRMWPTPRVGGQEGYKSRAARKGHEVAMSYLETAVDFYEGNNGGQLSPDWTEWLMGWPIGHTASEPLATDKFQQWLRSHGVCSEGQTPIVCQGEGCDDL